ncbi:MAG TPA: PAS domain-containing protein [Candidatus Sulfotelmatobacter sp.]|nr:PAS domain-containing protein [Candidatus Sulfotelmatobacter sp.]
MSVGPSNGRAVNPSQEGLLNSFKPVEPVMNVQDNVNILMVDDQPGKLLSYEAILSELGENLIKASSAKEALEKLLKTDVAVVLMDVSMPDIDGFELAELIRQHPRFQKTAIIFISAVHLSDIDRLKGYQHGAVDYLSVPVVPEVLRAKVRVFAELHRKKLQLERLNSELEQRVAERTQEIEQKALALERANTDLAQKNQELAAIVQTAPDIIFSRQPDGGREYISSRFYEYTGAPLHSGVGNGWMEYVHPDDKEASLRHWMHCVQTGQDYESEYRLRGADSKYRWFRARAVPLRDSQGNILKWYGTCSDIHDSKLLEQSIRENAIELENLVNSRTAELRRLSSRLMTMQDEERRRIAREVHDGLGQELAAAKMIMDGILAKDTTPGMQKAAADASQLVDRAIQQVRTISHLLHPPLLDEVGLVSALRWFIEGLRDRSGIEIQLQVSPGDLGRLKSDVETAIFRIIQEAVTNMFRHSGAHNGKVSIVEKEQNIVVTVQDDGKGIDEDLIQLRPDSVGIGIGGMRQRVSELGGTLRLANANPGAIVEVVIPARRPEAVRIPAAV